MKKTWFTHLLIIALVPLSLGFLDVSTAFGYIHYSHNNYISNTSEWSVHDAYVYEKLQQNLDDLKKYQLRPSKTVLVLAILIKN